jgi:DNA repair protein RadD
LRIDYRCRKEGTEGNLSTERISEWVCFNHEGFARQKASVWWLAHSLAPVPESVEDAIDKLDRHTCRMPRSITTKLEGRWPRIVSVEFGDEKPEPSEWIEEQLYSDEELPF